MKVFGYGSLVNRATHAYPSVSPARLAGWRRCWVHVASRRNAFLSVEPAADSEILGLVCDVPAADVPALDRREAAYQRHEVAASIGPVPVTAELYRVPAETARAPTSASPVLLSYIDVVVQGFCREFGDEGAEHFFRTTAGWAAPVVDDRASPVYSRAQVLTASQRATVDAGLLRVGAPIIPMA